MMRSMFSGVSGLKVHQTKMDVIGNNISNVNTVGYKAQRVTFNEVFSQTLQGASSASDDTGRGGRNAMQVGLGVNVSSIDMLMTQGAAERTDNPFDLMINGSGFLVVGDASGQYYTRNGALRVDDDGNLCIPNGMKVRGWKAEKGEIMKGAVQDISLKAEMSSEPKATTKASLLGNIDATETKEQQTSISFYDSLGNYFRAAINIIPDGTDAKKYKLEVAKVTDADGNELVIGKDAAEVPAFKFADDTALEFDTNGKLAADQTIKMEYNGDETALLLKNKKGEYTPYTGMPSEVEISCKKDDVTRFASKNTLKSKAEDGNEAGTMSGYSIGADGIITATYTNGDSRKVAQVVLAEFDNPAGLEKVGENLFKVTSNSGDFDGIGTTGEFSTGCLEMSNVDLSTEFTQMITTQRGFQANSRIISVSDEMLQELTNLKR